MKDAINNYFENVKSALDKVDRSEIENFINLLYKAKNDNRTIFVMGNGGSASTASHFVADVAKGVSYGKEKRFNIVCLNDNIPMMLAYANDVGYEEIFVEQLKHQLKPNDVVIGFSGSGNSKNVLKAIVYANSKDAVTVGVTGYDGGELKKIVRHSVNSNVNDMQISEEVHLMLLHLAMRVLYDKENVK